MNQRITITLDNALVEAAQQAVSEGRSASVSAYVGESVALRSKHDARLSALSALIADYEQQHGVISDDELAEQEQRDRDTSAGFRSAQRLAG